MACKIKLANKILSAKQTSNIQVTLTCYLNHRKSVKIAKIWTCESQLKNGSTGCSAEIHALQAQTVTCTPSTKISKNVTTKGFDRLGGGVQAQKVSGSNSYSKIQENSPK